MSRKKDSFEKALDAYYAHFGENYPLCISMGYGTEEELVANIYACIEKNEKAPEPDYTPGALY